MSGDVVSHMRPAGRSYLKLGLDMPWNYTNIPFLLPPPTNLPTHHHTLPPISSGSAYNPPRH